MRSTPRRTSGVSAVPQRPLERRATWLRRRARNVARRPMAVAAYGAVIFVAALVALVIVPSTARRAEPPTSPLERPDTAFLRRALTAAQARSDEAERALASARAILSRPPPEPVPVDTLPVAIRARRDSLAEASGSLARLIRRAEEAPLVASWRQLGESPHLRGSPRVREIVDSLVELDRSRSDFGAAGGVDPIFVALTARAAELGRELQEIAEGKRAQIRVQLDRLRPVIRARAETRPTIDTLPLAAARDSARAALARREHALSRGRAVLRALDLDAAHAREEVARRASPFAMLAAALVLGLALGYAVTLAGEMRRPRVGDAREASAIAGVPMLARIRPRAEMPERMRRRVDRELSPLLDLVSGSYDVLHAELGEDNAHVSLIGVVADHAGVAATVSANLAATAAHLARTALVVDMDFETHAVSALLRTRRSPGVADLLARRIEWPEALRTAVVGRDRSVDVLPSGRTVPRGTLQGASAQLGGEIAHLVRRYDLVVVSAPRSKLGVVPAVAGAVRSVVICVRTGRTTVAVLEQLARSVADHGGVVRGLVVWEGDDPVPAALSEADRAAGRETPFVPQTTELPASGSPG